MAWFGKQEAKEETKAETTAPAKKTTQSSAISGGSNVAHVLKNPRITEKASDMQSMSVYTFDVADDATKSQIASAVKSVYNVSPRKIRIVQIPSKKTRSLRTGRTGVKIGGKKAYVYLNQGETITIA